MSSFSQRNTSLCISNQRIIDFYSTHTHIDFDVVNLLIVDFFEKTGVLETPSDSIFTCSHSNNITELISLLNKIKDYFASFNQKLIDDYVKSKTSYIQESKSLFPLKNRDLILSNNANFINNIKSSISNISNSWGLTIKVSNLLKQFHKIINTNTEQIITDDITPQIILDYESNFEANSTQFIQTIQSIFSEYVASKELLLSTYTNSDKKDAVNYNKILYEYNNILSSFKSISPNPIFESILSQTFSTASISKEYKANDGYILSRESKSPIFIESWNMKERNINLEEIQKYNLLTSEKGFNSILISQYSGITSKPHFHIEIIQNRVQIYIHNLNYSPDKIQIAVDIIDTISTKLSEFNSNYDNKYSIPKDVLDDINREYQSFILQKESILNYVKESHKKLLCQLDDIRFNSLDKYLSTRYSSCKKQGFTCDLCNSFHVPTLKGLAAHKRGCSRKLNPKSSIEQVSVKPHTGLCFEISDTKLNQV